jgi:hypothetical protein
MEFLDVVGKKLVAINSLTILLLCLERSSVSGGDLYINFIVRTVSVLNVLSIMVRTFWRFFHHHLFTAHSDVAGVFTAGRHVFGKGVCVKITVSYSLLIISVVSALTLYTCLLLLSWTQYMLLLTVFDCTTAFMLSCMKLQMVMGVRGTVSELANCCLNKIFFEIWLSKFYSIRSVCERIFCKSTLVKIAGLFRRQPKEELKFYRAKLPKEKKDDPESLSGDLLVLCSVNDHATKALFDTGCSSSTMDIEFARKITVTVS